MASSAPRRDEDWKTRYFKALNEFDEQERQQSEQAQRLYRDVLGLLQCFRGHDDGFDRQLDENKVALRRGDPSSHDKVRDLVKQAGQSAGPSPAGGANPLDALEQLLAALKLPPDQPDLLKKVRDHARNARGTTTQAIVQELGATLAALIHAPDTAPREVRDTLQTLLDRLTFPETAQPQLAKLTAALQKAESGATLRHVAKELADFVTGYVSELNGEIAELNRFLLLIKTRLDDLAQHIVREQQDRASAAAARDQLKSSVRRSLDDMRGRVSKANSVEALKTAIEEQIAVLDGNVSGYLQGESARTREIELAHRELSEKMTAMSKEAETLRRQLAKVQARAMQDALTGLPNRHAYEARLKAERGRMVRKGTPLSLAMVDIDHFKAINDTWGHQAGDRVLKHLAKELNSRIRAEDFLGRYGGEEFVLLLPDTQLAGAMKLAEDLRRHIESCQFTYKQMPIAVTISCGITEFAAQDEATEAFERADRGLYVAKDAGRNRCEGVPR